MDKCKNCGKEVMSSEDQERQWMKGVETGKRWYYGNYCDGVMTLDTDPYAVEINDDNTLYWNCEGNRHESAMDI